MGNAGKNSDIVPAKGSGEVILLRPTAADVKCASDLIASMISNRDVIPIVEPILSREMFTEEKHQACYDTIMSIYSKGDNVDLVSVTYGLQAKGFDGQEMLKYLTKLTLYAGSGVFAERWAMQLADGYMRRELNKLSVEMVGKTADLSNDTDDLICYQSARVEDIISHAMLDVEVAPIEQVTDESLRLTKERIEARLKGKPSGMETGIEDLDTLLGGVKKKKLYIFAGRPGMGKTSVLIAAGKNVAKRGGRVMICSLEMTKEEIADKMILSECDVDSERYRDGFLNKQELQELEQAKQRVDALKVYIDDKTGLTTRKLRSKLALRKRKGGVDMLIIDYIQLMVSSEKKGNREQEVSEITRDLKSISKDYDIAVIALSQLNREVEKRPGKIPQLSDLRESGSIEQDADLVGFLYRPEYYHMESFPNDPMQSTNGIGQIIVAKHRGGSVGEAYFSYDPPMNKIGTPKNAMDDFEKQDGSYKCEVQVLGSLKELNEKEHEQANVYNEKEGFEGADVPF
jgi:replicative DNA helicase